MATGSYPRSGLRKIMKKHQRHNLAKGVELMLFLDYVAFLDRMMKRAESDAQAEPGGTGVILPRNIRKVEKEVLKSFQG